MAAVLVSIHSDCDCGAGARAATGEGAIPTPTRCGIPSQNGDLPWLADRNTRGCQTVLRI